MKHDFKEVKVSSGFSFQVEMFPLFGHISTFGAKLDLNISCRCAHSCCKSWQWIPNYITTHI